MAKRANGVYFKWNNLHCKHAVNASINRRDLRDSLTRHKWPSPLQRRRQATKRKNENKLHALAHTLAHFRMVVRSVLSLPLSSRGPLSLQRVCLSMVSAVLLSFASQHCHLTKDNFYFLFSKIKIILFSCRAPPATHLCRFIFARLRLWLLA